MNKLFFQKQESSAITKQTCSQETKEIVMMHFCNKFKRLLLIFLFNRQLAKMGIETLES